MSATGILPQHQTAFARILAGLGEAPPPSPGAFLVMTVGLPGSGKSMFSRRLGRATGAIVLESDAFRLLLFEPPAHSPPENAAVFRLLHAVARYLLGRGVSVIIDATSLTRSDRRPVFRLAETAKARVLIIRFDAPVDFIEARLGRRLVAPDPEDRSRAGIDVYGRMASREEEIGQPHWLVDTSDPAAVERVFSEISAACFAARAGTEGRKG